MEPAAPARIGGDFGVGQEAVKQLLAWGDGKGNLYGNYQKMLHVELPESAMYTSPDVSTATAAGLFNPLAIVTS